MFRTSNPALNNFNVSTWDQLGTANREQSMTVQGVVNKSMYLIAITSVSAIATWHYITAKTISASVPAGIGCIAALIISLIICFVPRTAPFLAWAYALVKGAGLAGISYIVAAMLEAKMARNGGTAAQVSGAGLAMVFQAVVLTFGIFFGLLVAYTARLIRLSDPWKRGIISATLGLCFFYLAAMLLRMFGVAEIGFIWNSGALGIGFSIFVVVLAAANLVLDFQTIEEAAQDGAPKWMEWYGAYALLVTLAWLYIEVLRLLSKLKDQK